MNVWTRTLNLDDAHTLLAIAEPGLHHDAWSARCHAALGRLSPAREKELIRLLRTDFLRWTDDARIARGPFLDAYSGAPATAQIDLVHAQWALTHPLSLVVGEALIAPALAAEQPGIALQDVDDLVASRVTSASLESLRKTRTVLLHALEGVGALATRGTGQHRRLMAARGTPHPITFGYLLRRDLAESGRTAIPRAGVYASLPARLTWCSRDHVDHCLSACLDRGILHADEVA